MLTLHRIRALPMMLVVCLAATVRPADAQTADRVVTRSGTVTGRVVATDSGEVQVEDRNGETKRIPVDQIREVQFGGEPQELKVARSMLLRGRPSDAEEELAKMQMGDLDGAEQILLDEVDYVRAAAAGRAALATGTEVRERGRLVQEFLARHPQSHHTFEMQELLGDLLVRAELPDKALAEYAKLAKGPPAFKVRAASARATMLLEQAKYAEALGEFEAALAVDAADEASVAQKRRAELGRARCLSGLGRADDAVSIVRAVIRQTDPEDAAVLGDAYNTLGLVYRGVAGREQDALVAFLTVDLVYNSVPESHAEALYNLVDLWDKATNPERSREARSMLETAYPKSPWARRLAGAKS